MPPRRKSESTTAQVNAAEIALNGVREEARVGQRTTLDVLNAQQELVNARVALVTAQLTTGWWLRTPCWQRVGALSMPRLGLNVLVYDPMVHYQQVRDAWMGVRNPDGQIGLDCDSRRTLSLSYNCLAQLSVGQRKPRKNFFPKNS